MKNLGYYNGEWGLLEEMKVPMNDRACWFGDGVYDAGPSRNYKMFAIEEHIDRFFSSAEQADIRIPVSRKELKEIVEEMLQKVDTGDNFVYFQVSRGTAIRNHTYEDGPGNLWIMIKPGGIEDGSRRIRLVTEADTRFLHCNVKTLNLLPAVLISQRAQHAGADEAVLYRQGGRITECAHSNVSILKDGELITAPLDNLILPGICRKHLIKACRKLGVPVREEEYYLPDLLDADEIIVTSSSWFAVDAYEIDGKPAGGKAQELLKAIRKEMLDEFYEETK